MSISTYKVTKKSAHIQVFSLDMCRLNYGLSLYRDFFSALYKGEWYFCVYRKGPNDRRHKFLMSVSSDALTFQDNLLSPGETAEYFVRIRYKDGRVTTNSNTVVVTAPNEKAK